MPCKKTRLLVQRLLVLMTGGLCAAFVLTAAAAAPKPITVAVGQEFELVLESPPASNCQWLLSQPLDETHLQQRGREYRRAAPSGTRWRGCEVLRYKALAEGKTQIHLKYASLWQESSHPTLSSNFFVVITNAASQTHSRKPSHGTN